MVHADNGAKEIIYEDGHTETFENTGSGLFTAPIGMHKELRADKADGREQYRLTFKDGTKYVFNKRGHLQYTVQPMYFP